MFLVIGFGVSYTGNVLNLESSVPWNQFSSVNFSSENMNVKLDDVNTLLQLPQVASAASTERRHACERCGKTYKWKHGLLSHMRRECGKDPQFFCNKCTYKTCRKENLIRHYFFKHKIDLRKKKTAYN